MGAQSQLVIHLSARLLTLVDQGDPACNRAEVALTIRVFSSHVLGPARLSHTTAQVLAQVLIFDGVQLA